jgi:hypothetical protein
MKKISLTFIFNLAGAYMSTQWADNGTNLVSSPGAKWLPCHPTLGFNMLSLTIRLLNVKLRRSLSN